MTKGLKLTTIGALFAWATETTAGTKPTSFKAILDCTGLPGINPEADSIDMTPTDALKYKEYAQGLMDPGGNWAPSFNLTEVFMQEWDDLVAAYEDAKDDGKSTWFEVYIPNLSKAFYLKGEPSPLGLSDIEVNAGLQIDASITINEVSGWGTAIEPAVA